MAKQNPCSGLQQRQILKKKLCKIYEAIFCLSCEGGGNAWKIAPLCITWVGLLHRPHTTLLSKEFIFCWEEGLM